MTRGWRKLNNERLCTVYTSPNYIREIKSSSMTAGHVSRIGEMRNYYKILVQKPEGKILFTRPKRKWKGIIEMGLKEIIVDCVESVRLAHNRSQWRPVVNIIINIWVP
jgi:hypothetical protein